MTSYYKDIAGLKICINLNGKVSSQVIHDLGALPSKSEVLPDITINFSRHLHTSYSPCIYSAKGLMNFNQDQYFVGYLPELNYTVKNLFNDKPVEINVLVRQESYKSKLKKIIKFFYTLENTQKDKKNIVLSYSLFWYVFSQVLLSKQKAFLHGGIFYNNMTDFSTVIAGTGGCGKTSTLFKMLENKEMKYVAEDYGIIDASGMTYYNPKPVSVYASDVEYGQKILAKCIDQQPFFNRLAWIFKNKFLKKNPVVKVKPENILGERIQVISRIKNVLYFLRCNNKTIEVKDIGVEELSERVLDSSLRELKTFNELLLLMRANFLGEYQIPKLEEIIFNSKKIYMEAFSKTNNKLVLIPLKERPSKIVSFLEYKGLF